MEIIVKRKILQNFLENFIGQNDMGGSSILQGTEHPIVPSPEMPTQLSQPELPITDEEWKPTNLDLLQKAAYQIARAVPDDSQSIRQFYQGIHDLLDKVYDEQGVVARGTSAEGDMTLFEDYIRSFITEAGETIVRRKRKKEDDDEDLGPEISNEEYDEILGRLFSEEITPSDIANDIVSYLSQIQKKVTEIAQAKASLQSGHADEEFVKNNRDAIAAISSIVDLPKSSKEYQRAPKGTPRPPGGWPKPDTKRRVSPEERYIATVVFVRNITGRGKLIRSTVQDPNILKYRSGPIAKKYKAAIQQTDISSNEFQKMVVALVWERIKPLPDEVSQDIGEIIRNLPTKEYFPPGFKQLKSQAEKDAEREQRAVEKFLGNVRDMGTVWTHAAEFFGFKNASGIRQWFMKHVERKFKFLMTGYAGSGEKSEARKSFLKIWGEMLENTVADYLRVAPSLLKKLQTKESVFAQNPKKNGTPEHQKIQRAISALGGDDGIVANLEDFNATLLDVNVLDKPDEAGDYYDEVDEALRNAGGVVARIGNQHDIFREIYNDIQSTMNVAVAAMLVADYKINESEAESLAEYFTGTKNIPDFGRGLKTAKRFEALGIDSNKFAEILDKTEGLMTKIYFKEFRPGGKYMKLSKKKLNRSDEKLEKSLLASIDDYFEEIAQREATKGIAKIAADMDTTGMKKKEKELADVIKSLA